MRTSPPSQTRPRMHMPITARVMTAAFDVMALFLSYIIPLWLRAYLSDYVPADLAIRLIASDTSITGRAYIVVCAVILLLFTYKGHYKRRLPWWTQVLTIVKVITWVFLFFAGASVLTTLHFSLIQIAMDAISALVFLILLRLIVTKLRARLSHWRMPTVVMGDYITVTDTLYALYNDPSVGYAPDVIILSDTEITDDIREQFPPAFRDITVYDALVDAFALIEKYAHCFFMISIDPFRGETRDRVMSAIFNRNIAHILIPSFSRRSPYETKPQYFFGHDIMMMHPKTQVSSWFESAIKRAMDIALSASALLFFMPVLITMMITIKLEGQGGSLFYGGKRLGKNGQYFKCWKFRTMEPDSDHLLEAYLDSDPKIRAYWETYRKLDHDPRVTTRTAKFVRKASLDEIPQLWNVLIGDMSIVGPRPILGDEIALYGAAIEDYKKVRPGLTGLWQVSGRNAVSFARRVYWDSWYIRNWSLWNDIVIILKTVKVVLTRHGAS